MKSDVLVTGSRGYLASNLIKPLSIRYNVECSHQDIRDITTSERKYDMVMHFAGPSDDEDFKDKYRVSTTMINGTMNMLDVASRDNSTFIFASTLGVEQDDLHKPYILYKLAMENYIKSVYNNYVILRIPRVYSKCRTKGLMKKLRNNTVPEQDMANEIEYLPLSKFVEQTVGAIHAWSSEMVKTMTYNYTDLTTDTIADIKERYI